MKLAVVLIAVAALASAADVLDIFHRQWTVPVASDWKTSREGGEDVLHLAAGREPLPGPRRPIQFAITGVPDYQHATIELDVQPLGSSLMIVFAYRDAAHFDYAHLSTDTGMRETMHNGIFHVYGGERVRISSERGPAAFAATGRWYHVKLVHEADTGNIAVTVDGRDLPALRAVDMSLGAGKFGIGSFDETGLFKNLKIATTGTH